ncbi:hypothetical protein [Frischella perrara]|uniref:hypothetical protein n=1 Tax=Frischella perrara TaxID=1267021 RepID=UPI0023F3283E|nr:hypothetical protein [Frischella perrara]
MAKQIKVISCPNCGSVQKTEIKPEHYRCDNCNTEYFLDNDDINVNVNYESNSGEFANFLNANGKLILMIVGVIAGISLVGVITSNLFKSDSRTKNYYNSQTTSISTPVKSTVTEPKKKTFTVNYHYHSLVSKGDKAYIISIVQRDYDDYKEKNKYYFIIHDLLTNKIIKEEEIKELEADKYKAKNDWDFHDFSQTKTYLVVNKKYVFLIDKSNFNLTNVTSSLLNSFPQYNTGLASIKIDETQGSGEKVFRILTDDGQKIYYYPIYDKALPDNNDFYMTKKDFIKQNKDTSEHIAFAFSNDPYGQYNPKLIKFKFTNSTGKNYYTITTSTVGEHPLDGSPAFTDDANAYWFDTPRRNETNEIISHQNLTPNRLYFNPGIIYADDPVTSKDPALIIKTKKSASPDANYNYQRIDINSGKVIWTISEDKFKIKNIYRFNDNFIFEQSSDKYGIITPDGTIKQEITLSKESKEK